MVSGWGARMVFLVWWSLMVRVSGRSKPVSKVRRIWERLTGEGQSRRSQADGPDEWGSDVLEPRAFDAPAVSGAAHWWELESTWRVMPSRTYLATWHSSSAEAVTR